jgi:hypothetical protein
MTKTTTTNILDTEKQSRIFITAYEKFICLQYREAIKNGEDIEPIIAKRIEEICRRVDIEENK